MIENKTFRQNLFIKNMKKHKKKNLRIFQI